MPSENDFSSHGSSPSFDTGKGPDYFRGSDNGGVADSEVVSPSLFASRA
jgi:hypothetical protein